jgi:outer membrane protein assembly factor BamB
VSLAAIARHRTSMRRLRRRYFIAIGAVVAVVGVVVGLVWSNSEIVHAHLHTAAAAAPSVSAGPTATRPTQTWHSSDATAIGQPLIGGTVVTYSAHTVTGRNARTGAAVWTYTRTDRDVCQVAQIENKAIAIYMNNGDCNEVTTLDSGTGKRQWERTLDEDGMTVEGRPTFLAVSDTLFVSSDSFIYAIDPVLGYDRWSFKYPAGCRSGGFTAGASGVLISEKCSDGTYLALRDRYQSTDDQHTRITWRIKTNTVPMAAESFLGALNPSTGQMINYSPSNGKVMSRLTLTGYRTGVTSPLEELPTANAVLVRLAGQVWAIDADGQTIQWTASLSRLPTVTSDTVAAGALPPLSNSTVLVALSRGVQSLDGSTGAGKTTYTLDPAPQPGSDVYPLGTGFLVAGPSTTVFQ